MQDLLSRLDPTIAIILIVAGVLVLVIVVILARRLRRRQSSLDDTLGASPGLSGPVDYTSLPLDDEPTGWRERFARLSLAGKILIILVPILAILGILIVVLSLMSGPEGSTTTPLPTPINVELTVTKADVIRINPVTISIAATTKGLPDGTAVVAELLADGQPVAYLQADGLTGEVQNGQISLKPGKDEMAAPLRDGVAYMVRVSTADGQASHEIELTVPPSYADTIFGAETASTSTPTPTVEPTETTAAITTTVEPSVTPTAAAALVGPEVKVSNGGNVRALPFRTSDNRVGGVDAGNTVQLIERTPNGEWHHISFINTDNGQRTDGWISTSLLTIPADVQAKIKVAPIVSVFKNGAVYEQPEESSTQVDRVNVDEVVRLKQKTAAGDWYEIENVRGFSGWVPASLLGIPADVAAAVAVAP
ncbi:MAG: SH3 domain-containing protein [Oscillochloris sp.]|nr:SH3 domain-containing protein [Oscillochloris sp.]